MKILESESLYCVGFLWMKFIVYRTSKTAVEEQRRNESQLSVEVEAARTRISEIQQELESVVEQLGEAKVRAVFCLLSFITRREGTGISCQILCHT